MKTLRKLTGEIDSARVAVVIGLMIGLGLVIHEGFFLLAAAIAIGALIATAIHVIHEHSETSRLAYRAR